MIIVSQDKKMIVNFENITVIGTCVQRQEEIGSRTTNGDSQVLGKYKTEERAKEVLKQIENKYLEYASIQNGVGNVSSVATLPRVYEMPKE